MSTIFLGEILPVVGDYRSSMRGVESRRESPVADNLADYVRRARQAKGFSTTDVEKQSRVGGAKGISDAYVTRIENGYVTNVSPAKLSALARGLHVPEEEIFEVVRGKRSVSGSGSDAHQRRRELLLWMFDDIPEECQLDVLASVAGIHTRRGLTARIHERHEARAYARNIIDEKVKERESDQPGKVRRHPAVTDTPREVPLPTTTPEDLGEEEQADDWRDRPAVNGKNGTEN